MQIWIRRRQDCLNDPRIGVAGLKARPRILIKRFTTSIIETSREMGGRRRRQTGARTLIILRMKRFHFGVSI